MLSPGIREAMHHVRGMAARGVPFERIEAAVADLSGLEPDERDVLWLYAWLGSEVHLVRQLIEQDEDGSLANA